MLKEEFELMYTTLRLDFYKKIFSHVNNETGVSISDLVCAEIIFLLKEPSIKEFSDFIGVSQPNATYKIKNLIDKGYIVKRLSEVDKRESFLMTTEKFNNAFTTKKAYGSFILDKIENLNEEEIKLINEAISIINEKVLGE